MTPYSNRMDTADNYLDKDIRKLRKPVIEKMRRDRINSSIEQLRILLEKDFKKQQLPSKPEKADILEMTVELLRKQLQRTSKGMASQKPPSNQDSPTFLQGNVKFIPVTHNIETNMGLNDASLGRTVSQNINSSIQMFSKQLSHNYPTTADLWRPW
ncbi:transcription factor HES-5-like [Bombina bombina]|uniref:transcription factor HES-5-like n=1 Tax=Bombina bombina TaxID=8345 RepID=UPI00235AC223|nr:transcription factor HES-5-like [Bombina bombina]